jgi:hypothetical protein
MWSPPFSRSEKYSIGVLSLLAFALRVPLAFRTERALTVLPYGDDAYYLFSIARNLAAGHGPTVDGAHLTNGFQPLILLFYAPIFWLCGSDAWLAVRWTFILNGVIAALSVWAVALLIRTLEKEPQTTGITAPIIGAALWTFTFQIFSAMTNGLETGLASLLLIAALTFYANLEIDHAKGNKIPMRQWMVFGVLLGFAVLARIDAAIFVVIVVLVLLVKRKTRGAIATGASALIVSAPWWIFNWAAFGNVMPTSGQAENSWPMPKWENIQQATKAISDMLSLIFYLPGSFDLPVRIVWALLLTSGILFVGYRTNLLERIRTSFRLNSLVPLLLFSIALVVYYTFFFRAPHFIARYLQPARMLWSVMVVISVSVLWQKKITRIVLATLAVLGLTFTIAGYADDYFPARQSADLYDMGIWAKNHPTEKIAMLQSGIASFIAPNIINLDGKVNTDALRAHQEGRLAAYLRDEHFTYIADYKSFIADIDTIARKNELYFDSVSMIGGIQLMKRRTIRSTSP